MLVAAVLALVCALGSARAQEQQQGQLTKAPKLTTFVEAEYPADKRESGVTASVLLGIEIAADGTVEDVKVVESGGADFDAAAVAAARRFVFEPAEVDGVPAPVRIEYRYTFKIDEVKVKLGPQVNFEGVVLERFTKKPLAGVTVTVVDTGATLVTDEQGTFSFIDVPVGTHQVQLSSATLITVSTQEDIAESKKKTVRYLAEEKQEGVDEEVVVRAPRIRKESTEVSIRTEEARRVPGTQGDTLKVVQNLPGVARSSFGSGQLVVWGSAPRDTRVNVDGVEIPALYHVGGLRSTINSGLVKGIDLTPGAYGGDYGRGLGGLVRVETRAPQADGVHGVVSADVMDASAQLSAAVTPTLRVAGAVRYSYLDRVLTGVVSQDVGDFFPIPRYNDYQLQGQLDLRKDESLSALVLGSNDYLKRTVASSDPAQVRSETTDSSFSRVILRYSRILEDGSSFVVTPSVGMDSSHQLATFGPTPALLDMSGVRWGVRGSYRRKVDRGVTLALGLDLQGAPTHVRRQGSLNLPAREGDIFVFGQRPSDESNADTWDVNQVTVSPYATAELRLGALTLNPGLRLSGFLLEASRLTPSVGGTLPIGRSTLTPVIEPRLSASYKLRKDLTLNAAAGVYYQAPAPEEMSAVFGNPTLLPQRAVHATAGASWRITGTLTADAVGFYKTLDNLVARSPYATPQLARALTQDGTGRSYGAQFLVRQELWQNFFGWVTYSLSRSERRDSPDAAMRLFDYDQTHVLGVVGSYQLGPWTLGARVRFATGAPRTPVASAFYDVRDDVYQPLFGSQNSVRIPSFYQVDLRAERDFQLGGGTLNVYLDMQNVTNRQNPEEITYNFDYRERKYIVGLPVLAVAGLRYQF
ncbi:TonB-dependent receptor domain-containing protein [Corallococcus silvisoli]|uniref:TonB-dependent receptor domain-containing protein n=1 Tax=Corallococcus silvisoli TaxID=2697031 RepID=UPI0013775923|nr:TonB-dependent receptor [Corallococcus silvisoli]NBD08764.1 TonB-dependent receptor [Corallococcus silvisoli]